MRGYDDNTRLKNSHNSQSAHGSLHQSEPTQEQEPTTSDTDTQVPVPTMLIRASISTDRIMQAVQQQKHITQQIEHLHRQQETRMEQMRPVMTATLALGLFTASSIPLLCFILLLTQTDLLTTIIALFGGVLDTGIILSQYLSEHLTMLTHNTWLLSGVAFAVVVMMGMWLRLMRPPREA